MHCEFLKLFELFAMYSKNTLYASSVKSTIAIAQLSRKWNLRFCTFPTVNRSSKEVELEGLHFLYSE